MNSIYLEELAALEAVGALDGEDVGEFKRLAPNVSAGEQREIVEFQNVAALIALICEQRKPPATIKQRLMNRVP